MQAKLGLVAALVVLALSLTATAESATDQAIASLNAQATTMYSDPFSDPFDSTSSTSSTTTTDTTDATEAALLAKIAAENVKVQEQNAKLAALTVKKITIKASTSTTPQQQTKQLEAIAKKIEAVKVAKQETKSEVKELKTQAAANSDTKITFQTQPVVKAPEVAQPVLKVPEVAKPVVKVPEIAKPVVKAPEVAKPVEKAPEIAKPVVKVPEIAKPVVKAHRHHHHHKKRRHHHKRKKTKKRRHHHRKKKTKKRRHHHKKKKTKKRRHHHKKKKTKKKWTKRKTKRKLSNKQLRKLKASMTKEFVGIYKRIKSHGRSGRSKVKAKAEKLFKEESTKTLLKLRSPAVPKTLTTGMPAKQVVTVNKQASTQPDGSKTKLQPAPIVKSDAKKIGMVKPPVVTAPLVPTNKLQLASGWSNMGFDLKPAAAKMINGVCYLSGTVKKAGTGVSSLIAQLPLACRPNGRLVFTATANNVPARVDVLKNGQVHLIASKYTVHWVALDGISFNISPTANFKFVNGWSNYGLGYRKASVQYERGVCTFSGLIKGRTPTYLGVLKGKNSNCIPKERLIFSVNNHLNSIRVDVLPSGYVMAVGPPRVKHRWISLDGISYTANAGRNLNVLKPNWYNFNAVKGGKFRKASFKVVAGICRISGVLYSKTWTAMSQIAKLPKSCRPSKRIVFGANVQLGNARVDVLPNGRMQFVYARKRYNWLSLDGINFPVFKKQVNLSEDQRKRRAAIHKLFIHYQNEAKKNLSKQQWRTKMSNLRKKVLAHLESLKTAGVSNTSIVQLQKLIATKTKAVNATFEANASRLSRLRVRLELKAKKLKSELLQKHKEKLWKHKRKRYFERQRKQMLSEKNKKRLKKLEGQKKLKRRLARQKMERLRKKKRKERAYKLKAQKLREKERKRHEKMRSKAAKKSAESVRNLKVQETIQSAVKTVEKKLAIEAKDVQKEQKDIKVEKKAAKEIAAPPPATKSLPQLQQNKPLPQKAKKPTASLARCKKALVNYIKRGKLVPQCTGTAKTSCLVQRKKYQAAMMKYLHSSCSNIGKSSTEKACAIAVAIYSKNINTYITKCNNLKGHNLAVCNSKLNSYKSWYRPVKAICFNSYSV